jgi:hypothetical protein
MWMDLIKKQALFMNSMGASFTVVSSVLNKTILTTNRRYDECLIRKDYEKGR